MCMAEIEALEFRVERWDDGGQRMVGVVAACNNSLIAKAAYDAAVRMHPKAHLMLRHRARIIARAKPAE